MPTMNSRIQYNSESEKLTLKEIFKICLEDFIRDFSFGDIKPQICRTDIFTPQEIDRIASEENTEKQTCLMFFILLNKNIDYKDFFAVLQDSYDSYSWLPQKVIETYNLYLEGNKEINIYINAVHELRSHFPKHGDFNVHRLDYFYQTRNLLRKLQLRHCLVIHGEPGVGKKWLSLDVCCDHSVMQTMNFKIFWMDVHDCNSQEKDLEKLQRLKLLLGEYSLQKKVGDYEGISNKILELQQDLRTCIKKDEFKDCLLVLVDVQNRKTLEAFNLPCKILITTRNKNIIDHLPSNLTKTVHVHGGLNQFECTDLFERVLMKSKRDFPENYNDIFHQIKGHPFLLNIIAQNLKGQPRAEWQRWIQNLEHFRIKDDKVNKLIELSFNVLNKEEQHFYNTLSIFHHSVKIPIKVLASLWNMSEINAQILVKKFDKFSLVNMDHLQDDTIVCIIHFLYYSFLQNNMKEDTTYLHKRLVQNYNIEKVLANRPEFDLPELPNDNYFYYFIGYHLREAKMFELFSKLYLDFVFLGQKLRATGLASTIGDLKSFREYITENNAEKEILVNSLLEFLPNIEEMIFTSSDTCLLQYALMAGGRLQAEAERQAKQFSDKIWFSDGDHFHKRRQMIKLPDKPKVLKLIEPDTCIIALDNDKMLLADLSLGYNIEPTKFTGHSDKVVYISLFLKNYMMSLDFKGDLRVWSIADERRRSVRRKPSSRSIDNHVINYENFRKMRDKKCLQQFTKDRGGTKVTVKTFHLDTREDIVYLHLVLSNGTINIHKWNDDIQRFMVERIPPLHTRLPNIRFVLTLFNRYYMILNNSGSLEIFKLTDGSSGCPTSFRWPQDTNSPVNIHHCRFGLSLRVICVFPQKVLLLRLLEQSLDFLNGDLETLYEVSDRRSAITCSSLSDDNRYLILGTKQGILVFDVFEKSEVLRNSISESIACVDICTLDDDVYKYVIVSGSEGRTVLNIFGLKLSGNHSITWANSISALINEEESSLQFEPNAWLLGKKLFDVNFNEDIISLVAVDSKNRIHHLFDNKWNMIIPPQLKCVITAITTFSDKYYFGCENGHIFDSFETLFETGFKTKVTYLELIDENTLVGSYENNSFIYENNQIYYFELGIKKCYLFANKYLILIDKNSSFFIINLDDNCSIIHKITNINECLKSADLKFNNLALATNISKIYTYKLVIEKETLLRPKYLAFDRAAPDIITSIALSPEGSLCAVGLETGLVEVYRNDKTWKLLQKLDSHKATICDLKFSPWTDLGSPMILASVAEQICFWDVTYVINNPLDNFNGFGRHSSRFNSTDREKNRRLSSKASPCTSPNPRFNPWSNKKGTWDKPELLACIKFAGNKAEKFYTNDNFTKFVTIDDEGEYYLLSVNEINTNGTTNGTNNDQFDDSAII